jgi:Na+-driven multidrug efflux pump
MVSHAMGEGHSEKVIPTVKRIAKVSVLYAFVLCVLLLIFSREFLSLYRNDDALITLAIPSLRVIVVALLLMSVATVVFNGVVGTGKTWINLSIEITCVLTYLLYCYIVIQKMRLPLQWAWASEFVYWGMLFSTASLYLRSNRWKGQKI